MLMQLGFDPNRLEGVDLQPDRVAAARAVLPPTVRLRVGDACQVPVAPGSLDMVLQFTVLSSVIEPQARVELASAMWRWLKPGGAVLSYDFVVPSPGNREVRPVTLSDLRGLFPQGIITQVRRVTLAPPLARALGRMRPSWLAAAARLTWLRTHRLVWIEKPAS